MGSGLRYSASAALITYGISRVILVVVWMSGIVISSASPFLMTLQYLFLISMGVPSIALALRVVQTPFVTRKHFTLGGLLLLTVGLGYSFFNLTQLLTFQYPELMYTSLSFYAGIAYNVLLIYLGFRLVRGDLALGRTTFTALALIAVAVLVRSVDLDYLIGVPLSGCIDILWPSRLLYTVAISMAFVTFVLAGRSIPVDLGSVTRRGEYTLFRGAILVYGLGMLYNFVIMSLLQFDKLSGAAGDLGASYYIVAVYLSPSLDFLFAFTIISLAAFMKQLAISTEIQKNIIGCT